MSVRSELKRAFRETDAAAAVVRFRAAWEAAPGDVRNALLLANALSDEGAFDEAEGLYRRAIEARPQVAAAHAFFGRSLLDRQRHPEAVAAAERALAIVADHALAHVVRGLARLAAGAVPEAVRELDAHAFADDPDVAGRLLVLLEADDRLPDIYHPAIPPGAPIGEIPPPPPVDAPPAGGGGRGGEARLRRTFYAGLDLRRRFRLGDALRAWQAVLAAVPAEPDTLLEMAATYYLLRRHDDALAVLDRLRGAARDSPGARALRGLALYAAGERDAARPLILAAVEREIEVEATDEPVDLMPAGMSWYCAGRIALEEGDRIAARKRFARVPAYDPLLVTSRWECFKAVAT